uniref:Transposase n=1 Tax=Heterorhabditis bacteriophora TaxID=37862 RepID=A0A1I7WXJ9_HETBA
MDLEARLTASPRCMCCLNNDRRRFSLTPTISMLSDRLTNVHRFRGFEGAGIKQLMVLAMRSEH